MTKVKKDSLESTDSAAEEIIESPIETLTKLTPQDITDILRARVEGRQEGQFDLSNKDLSGINFTTLCRRDNKIDFHSASFKGANLEGCDFTGISLQGCDFTGANLKDAILIDCNTQYSTGL